MKKSASTPQTGRDFHNPLPVLLFTSSVNPGHVSAYPAVGRLPFKFSSPEKIHLYPVHGLVFGVVR
jgi:hypothetical protein